MLGSSGTSNEPLVTVKATEAPVVKLRQVPTPEKLPVAAELEIEAIVTVPDSRKHEDDGAESPKGEPSTKKRLVHATLTVGTHMRSTVATPVVIRPMARTARSASPPGRG